MRDYGVVRTRFWEWAKRKKLSIEAREMALYLLTGPHGNSLGCFRLPMAYLCDDLDTTPKVATRTMEELQRIGFVHVDEEETGWIWIVDYLEHNPIPNGNVGKAVGKMIDQVPHAVSFYEDLVNRLEGVEFFPPNLIDTLRERYSNRLERVSRRVETHTQTHTHDPIHEQTHESDNSTAAKPGADKRGTRLADDWQLTDELRAFAVDHGLDPDETRAEFVDHWTSVPGSKGLKLDWGKTFKNRCRDVAKRPLFGRGESASDRRAREVQAAIERSKIQ